jgi:hypothetical protein
MYWRQAKHWLTFANANLVINEFYFKFVLLNFIPENIDGIQFKDLPLVKSFRV